MINLNQLISISYPPDSQFPANLKFDSVAHEEEYATSGIFFLFYRGELIYIGYTNNKQNVIAERVVKQLATITLRDHRIQFSDSASNQLLKEASLKSYFHTPSPIIANEDFQTSVNRVKFAAQHWDEFKNFSEETLKRFDLKWFPNPNLGKFNTIQELSKSLKQTFNPRCNQEYRVPKIS